MEHEDYVALKDRCDAGEILTAFEKKLKNIYELAEFSYQIPRECRDEELAGLLEKDKCRTVYRAVRQHSRATELGRDKYLANVLETMRRTHSIFDLSEYKTGRDSKTLAAAIHLLEGSGIEDFVLDRESARTMTIPRDKAIELGNKIDRYTADRAERAKLLAYGDVGHHRVVPFVLEEFGAMGPLTSAFFKECCRLREDRLDLEGQRAPWSARTWTSYWRQRLSVALTRAMADIMLRRYTADRAERAKLLAYGDVGHHRVVPFVLEEFGAMGPLTSAFFKECCRLREDRLDLEGQRAPWSARTWTSYWRQRLSVALTRAMADIMLAPPYAG
eukprot:jgi/Mesvir1/3658/Mv14950-RA.1